MPQLIKNNQVIDDTWILFSDTGSNVPNGQWIVSLTIWNAQKAQLQTRKDIGLWLNSDEEPAMIDTDINHFPVIAINFPNFTDGRGFSYARELREKGFKGELRAIGNFIRDQLFYLKRCGFDSFALEGTDLNDAIKSLQDFSESYQASIDQSLPLFRRRA
jgi:uncharacterized protein (DUF934 family)